jgi:hypothetical protein
MADAAPQRHQQLKNEANKMAMKISFFHGDDKEDTLDIKEMIRRFQNSADVMGLADNCSLGRHGFLWRIENRLEQCEEILPETIPR